MALRIAYYGNCWMTNLGEAFIDIGAMELLKQAVPDSDIIFITPMSKYYNKAMRSSSGKIFAFRDNSLKNASHLGLYITADVFVMSGMFATEEFITMGSASYWLDDFIRTHPNIKTLFMGIGGHYYTQREMETFLSYVRERINYLGFISRDNETYKLYKDRLSNCYQGIDCAFFVGDVYSPLGFSNKDYIVATFNRIDEPKEVKELKDDIIRPQHIFYTAKYNEKIKNIFISDSPYDYLSLYANAKEIHTDMVHATIVSLAYGKKVKYYHNSKRSFAFEAVGAVKDGDGYLYLPRETLNHKKQRMKEIVRNLCLDLSPACC